MERKNRDQTLTPVGHPFMTPAERRFAPITVRQDRKGVRYGLEQVSVLIGIRTYCTLPASSSHRLSNIPLTKRFAFL